MGFAERDATQAAAATLAAGKDDDGGEDGDADDADDNDYDSDDSDCDESSSSLAAASSAKALEAALDWACLHSFTLTADGLPRPAECNLPLLPVLAAERI